MGEGMAGQMVQWLRCWLLFLRTQDSISRIHMAAHTAWSSVPKISDAFLLQASIGTANSWCTGKSAGKKIKIKSKKQANKKGTGPVKQLSGKRHLPTNIIS